MLVEHAMASVVTLPKSGAAGAQAPADAGILVVDDIVKQFDTPEGPLIAVDRVSLSVRPGEFLAVIGPSGCGKSTLFNIIGGLLDGYQGAVMVGGETVRGRHPEAAGDAEGAGGSTAGCHVRPWHDLAPPG